MRLLNGAARERAMFIIKTAPVQMTGASHSERLLWLKSIHSAFFASSLAAVTAQYPSLITPWTAIYCQKRQVCCHRFGAARHEGRTSTAQNSLWGERPG